MSLESFVRILVNNFKLDASVAFATKQKITDSNIANYDMLLDEILLSKRFDFLSRLEEALVACKTITLEENEILKVQTYSDRLFSKTIDLFEEVDYQVQIGKTTLESIEVSRFLRTYLSNKDLEILKEIGNRDRLLFMCRNAKDALKTQINKIMMDKSLNKKKLFLDTLTAQETAIDNRVLKLVCNTTN